MPPTHPDEPRPFVAASMKESIGRLRFFGEALIALLFIKIGVIAAADLETRGSPLTYVVLICLVGLGLISLVNSSIKRLRDLRRNEWWAAAYAVPLPFILLAAMNVPYALGFGIVAAQLVFLFFLVLMLWPAPSPLLRPPLLHRFWKP